MGDAVVEIEPDKISNDKNSVDNTDEKNTIDPHNGEAITKMGISPNGEYLVTYSENDSSIVSWNVRDEGLLRPGPSKKLYPGEIPDQIGVSDKNKRAFITNSREIEIYDMMNNNQKILLDVHYKRFLYYYFTFNSEGELILYARRFGSYFIFVYSTKTKNNKWKYKRMYKIPDYFSLISISKYNKLYLFSNNSIYEHNLNTEKSIKIFTSNEKIFDYKSDIKIFSNEEFICIRIKNKIIIYSIESEIPIASLDINDGVRLCNFMHHDGLIPLLLPLLSNSNIWDRLKEEYPTESFPNDIQTTTNYAFGILDGQIRKLKLGELFTKMKLTFKNSKEFVEDGYAFNVNKKIDNPYMEILPAVFQKVIDQEKYKEESSRNLIIWEINLNENKLELQVFKKINVSSQWSKLDLICEKVVELWCSGTELLWNELYNINEIIVLTSYGLFIFHFNENNESISLNYYYGGIMDYNKKQSLEGYKMMFSKPTLPLPNDSSFRVCDEWISSIIESKENFSKYGDELLKYGINNSELRLIKEICDKQIKNNEKLLLKYGVKLLTLAIKKHDIELMEVIYKNCMDYFKKDFGNNRMFLGIIASTMSLLNKYYPEYISRYSSDSTMVLNSFYNNIKYENSNLHLHSFQYPSIVNLTQSIWWLKYTIFISEFKDDHIIIYWMLNVFHVLIILPILPIYFATFYILSKYHFIYGFDEYLSLYHAVIEIFKDYYYTDPTTPTITFMNPYVKFVNYPQGYNWFKELILPQSSPFVEIISKDIYKTWNGESLINFKWNKYGKYYYSIIWFGFMLLLGCFTAAATIPQQYTDNNIQKQLLVASIILGFIHLSFEVRQFIHNPIKWIRNFWNLFDLMSFILPIYTSIYWLQTNNRNVQSISFTCLFLDIKFLLFFRVFESFGIYFAIIVSVGKQISSFLVVLFIIIISFAHTFYILLSPESSFSFDEYTNNTDSNNPWNIAPTYHQVFDNGTVNSNPYMIQPPNKNTNMFVDFGTSIFAMYKFLTGDSSALSNWTYKDDPSLVILIVLFSLLVVVYLMNLFIGLLNNAIEQDNNRVSYLIQKAEILVEIELFYLLPHQRRWNAWFPDVIYYYADAGKTRRKIKELINEGEFKTNEFSKLEQTLFDELKIQHNSRDPVDVDTMRQILKENYERNSNSQDSVDEATLQKVLKENPSVDETTLRKILIEYLSHKASK
ncbi:hypothetical protein GLOIN_2v1874127 [Rhizophagus clarus]|uniref:Ion transport domain-containing protein n=1 Tax=Rhizophagus clarus TaxID=94130 RepID=A0A8H3M9N6_9GLOM|nr:hypothetical protein GLOIN_2v1874127 [Rhizophagus clarus]